MEHIDSDPINNLDLSKYIGVQAPQIQRGITKPRSFNQGGIVNLASNLSQQSRSLKDTGTFRRKNFKERQHRGVRSGRIRQRPRQQLKYILNEHHLQHSSLYRDVCDVSYCDETSNLANTYPDDIHTERTVYHPRIDNSRQRPFTACSFPSNYQSANTAAEVITQGGGFKLELGRATSNSAKATNPDTAPNSLSSRRIEATAFPFKRHSEQTNSPKHKSLAFVHSSPVPPLYPFMVRSSLSQRQQSKKKHTSRRKGSTVDSNFSGFGVQAQRPQSAVPVLQRQGSAKDNKTSGSGSATSKFDASYTNSESEIRKLHSRKSSKERKKKQCPSRGDYKSNQLRRGYSDAACAGVAREVRSDVNVQQDEIYRPHHSNVAQKRWNSKSPNPRQVLNAARYRSVCKQGVPYERLSHSDQLRLIQQVKSGVK